MDQDILTPAEVARYIAEGKTLLLAGEEKLLAGLPRGRWIGGTIPYFTTAREGGMVSREKIFATDISPIAASFRIRSYNQDELATVYGEEQAGCSFIIIPAMTEVHSAFALNAPNYQDFGARPLVGWIAGVHLDDLGRATPKVFNGETGGMIDQEAIVMHVTLPPGLVLDVGILNIFEQCDGDTLTFPQDGFYCREVAVNGVTESFVDYIERQQLDTKLPLVADYYGALINTSFLSVDRTTGEGRFFAPVFTGVRYKPAKKIADYAAAFTAQLKKIEPAEGSVVFSCNCILNYLHSGLEGRHTAPFVGPITFGEIAYQLLNQTLVYLQAHAI